MLVAQIDLFVVDAQAFESGADAAQVKFVRDEAAEELTIVFNRGGIADDGVDMDTLGYPSVTFAPGQTEAFVTVTPVNDTDAEPYETVWFALHADPYNYIAGSNDFAIVTITDNDAYSSGLPTVTIEASDPNAAESGDDVGEFTVSRSGAANDWITVAYEILGRAYNGADYELLYGSVTLGPGVSSAPITVTPIEDEDTETAEQVRLVLDTNYYYDLGPVAETTAVVTITDAPQNLPTVTITASDPEAAESSLDPGQFTVWRTGATTSALSVQYTIAAGATNGVDYNQGAPLSGSVVIPAGAGSQTITITPFDDATDEINEAVTLSLSTSASYELGMSNTFATVTLADNDGPTISIGDASVANEFGSATLSVTLSAASPQTITVAYATANGTATAGSDYTATSGTLTFNPGQTSKSVSVPVLADSLDELNETFYVNLSGATNGTIADSQGIATITDDDNSPTLTVHDATLSETATSLTVSVTLSAVSGLAVSFDYGTANGTATAGSDYTAASGTKTIAAGATSATFTISIAGDSTDEVDETILATISTPVNATIADGSATVTILDNDGPPVSIADVTASEGAASAVFTISLAGASTSGRAQTVSYATSGGAATSGTDFTDTSGTVIFAAGETTKQVSVPLAQDGTDEENETFTMSIAMAGGNSTIADGSATATITDDDAAPALTIADKTASEEATPFGFVVTLSAVSGKLVTVNFATANGTATEGTNFDYASASGTLTFSPGQTSQTVYVTVHDDQRDEAPETLFVNLSSATNATLVDNQGLGTILDNDPAPTINIGNGALVEANSNMSFPVTLSFPSDNVISVAWQTASGTATGAATALTDYTPGAGTLVFLPGQVSATVQVAIAEDSLDELDEWFHVNLSGEANATLGQAQGTGTIDDDDGPNISLAPVSVSEGVASQVVQITATLSAASPQTVSVNYATAAGTASSGADFTATSGTLTFDPGQTTKTFNIPLLSDALDEFDETFTVALSNGVDAGTLGPPATVTILDDDPLPSLSVTSATLGEAGGEIYFTVTLSAPSGKPVSVDWTTVDVSATGGSDYISGSGQFSFLPGESLTRTISIGVQSDGVDEIDELFYVELENPANAAIGSGIGYATIVDDDGPTISINSVSANEADATLTFTVSLSAASPQDVAVHYATLNNSATAGSDYTATSGELSFAAGETSKPITVSLLADTRDEFDQQFFVDLTSPVRAFLGESRGIATLLDDDAAPVVSFAAASLNSSGLESQGLFRLTALLSAPSEKNVSIAWSPASGTATAGSDFAAAGGQLMFYPLVVSQTASLALLADSVAEQDEQFMVGLSNAVNATLGGSSSIVANCIIVDDEPRVSIVAGEPVASEDGPTSGRFVVSRTGPVADELIVEVEVTGTADAYADYSASFSMYPVTIPAGEYAAVLDVFINNDSLNEGNETVVVALTPASGNAYSIAPNEAAATVVIDDNDEWFVGIAALVSDAFETEQLPASLLITRSGETDLTYPLTVNYVSPPGGSATYYDDYLFSYTAIVIPAGETSVLAALTVTDDQTSESDETVIVGLTTDPAYALAGSGTATATIHDQVPAGWNTVSISAETEDAAEGGPISRDFTITRTGPTVEALNVGFHVSGSASEGSDYEGLSVPESSPAVYYITIPANETTATLTVTPIADQEIEDAETVTVLLSDSYGENYGPATYAVGSQREATVTIADYDGPLDDVFLTYTNMNDNEVYFADLTPPNVLENDPISGTPYIVQQAQNGTVILNPDGTFQYAPNPNWLGTDQFTYALNQDPEGKTATVDIKKAYERQYRDGDANKPDEDVKATPGLMLQGGGMPPRDALLWFASHVNFGDILVLLQGPTDTAGWYLDEEDSQYGFGIANRVDVITVPAETEAEYAAAHKAANDSDGLLIDLARKAEGVFFGGGDQSFWLTMLKNSNVLKELNKNLAAKDLVIGGSSAGMAIIADYIYTGGLTASIKSAQALGNPFHENMTFSTPIFSLPGYMKNVITETHVLPGDKDIVDGRMGRSVAFLARMWKGPLPSFLEQKAIAASWGTAVVIEETGIGKVYGEDYVYFLQAFEPQGVVVNTTMPPTALTFSRVYVARLDDGGSFDVRNWRHVPSEDLDVEFYSLTVTTGTLYPWVFFDGDHNPRDQGIY